MRKDPRRHVVRRSKAAAEGRHLPTCAELLSGFPPLSNSLQADAGAWAERVVERVKGHTAEQAELRYALELLTVDPKRADFERALAAFEAVPFSDDTVPDLWDGPLRCSYYLACSGSSLHALRIAAAAISKAHHPGISNIESTDLVAGAFGWLMHVGQRWRGLKDLRAGGQHEMGELAAARGRRALDRAVEIARKEQDAAAAEEDAQATAPAPDRSSAKPQQPPGPAAVVLQEVAADHTHEGKAIRKAFERVIGKRLPLCALPDLAAVRKTLIDGFPHASDVTDALLDTLVGQPHVRLRPTILVGEAGVGKTSFAARLLTLLSVPFEVYSCGGVADASLAGTARRWSSGEPSLPLELVRRHGVASPGIVLDEIEKTATGHHNGNLLAALLGLLEPGSAARWHDPYIQAGVDLSHVVWIASANAVAGLSRPLLDRCQILRFPAPGPEHLERLAQGLLDEMVRRRSMDARWVAPLAPDEFDALRRAWPGGSLRALARLVEGVVRTRDRLMSAH